MVKRLYIVCSVLLLFFFLDSILAIERIYIVCSIERIYIVCSVLLLFFLGWIRFSQSSAFIIQFVQFSSTISSWIRSHMIDRPAQCRHMIRCHGPPRAACMRARRRHAHGDKLSRRRAARHLPLKRARCLCVAGAFRLATHYNSRIDDC